MDRRSLLLLGALLQLQLTGCIRAGFGSGSFASGTSDGGGAEAAVDQRAPDTVDQRIPDTLDQRAPDTAPPPDGPLPDAPLPPKITQLTATPSCSPEQLQVTLKATASDPSGGPLSYTWLPGCCGAITGSGPSVTFTPQLGAKPTCPLPVSAKVTSQASKLTTTQAVQVTITVRGDANGDGDVNAGDIVILQGELGRTDCCVTSTNVCKTDLDNDCDVDAVDLLKVQQALGSKGCACP